MYSGKSISIGTVWYVARRHVVVGRKVARRHVVVGRKVARRHVVVGRKVARRHVFVGSGVAGSHTVCHVAWADKRRGCTVI